MILWLLEEDVARQLNAAAKSYGQVSAAEQLEHEQRIEAREGGPRNLHIAGDVAEISIAGVLTQKPDFMLWLFGIANTTYADIQAAIAIAKNDPNVTRIHFNIDSPGGSVDGFFETLAAIEDVRAAKKVTVSAASALSAAYGIAAMAGPIEAKNVASRFGSVGVAVSYYLDENVIDLTNTDSPDKRPDLTTEEGRAVVVKQLDAIHELFVDAIARGRGTTTKDVTEGFGRGAVFVAGEAKKRGMIDGIAKPALRVVPTESASAAGDPQMIASATGGGRMEKTMNDKLDLKTLRAQHPDLYEAAVQDGVTKERDRVCAHLKMGTASGDLKTAHEAIEAGTEMTQTVMAAYMAAGMNRSERDTRQEETDKAGEAVDNVETPETTQDLGDQVVALIKQQGGL